MVLYQTIWFIYKDAILCRTRCRILLSETAAAHPAAELAGHPRRRRIKMETSKLINPKIEFTCPLSPLQAAGYYDKIIRPCTNGDKADPGLFAYPVKL
ncbi:Uncharacterised protein [uncultured archaeon]|nr:Uncharacterised protein [uncultured archaeon]